MGASLLIAVPIIASLAQERQRAQQRLASPSLPVNLVDNTNGVIVSEGRGHLVFINERARDWFAVEGESNIETLAEYVKPSETFLELFGKEGQASFRVGTRRIEASSYYIPNKETPQLVVVMRELLATNGAKGSRDPSQLMAVVSDITEIISSNLALSESLDAILATLNGVLTFDVGEITLWEPDLKILRPMGRSGSANIDYSRHFEQTDGVYHLDDSFSGWLARYRQPLLVSDMNARPDVRAKLNEYPFQSFLGVSLMLGERFIGTLELASKQRAVFDHEDLMLIQAVAGQTAIAIENARLHQGQAERVAELSGLQQIAQTMGAFSDPIQLYGQLVSRIGGLMNCDIVGILLYAEEQRTLFPKLPFLNVPDSVASLFRIPLHENTPLWPIWTMRDWWYSNNVSDEDLIKSFGIQKLVEALAINRMAFAPMKVGERRIGIVIISTKRDGSGFTEDDMRLLSVFASQTGIVVENARLYIEEQQRSNQQGGLESLAQMVTVLDDPAQLYGSVSERLAQLMNVQYAGLLLFNLDRSKLLGQEPFHGIDRNIIPYYEVDTPLNSPSYVLYTADRPWYVNDVENERLAAEAGLDTLARMVDLRQVLVAPLHYGKTTYGVLQVANKLSGQNFNEKDVALIAEQAQQASIILYNASSYREMRTRATENDGLRQIAEIGSLNLPLQETFQRILNISRDIFQCSITGISVFEPTTNKITLYPQNIVGLPSFTEPFAVDIYAPGSAASVSMSRRPFFSNTVARDSRVLPIYRAFAERFNIENVAQVPLVVRDQSVGEFTIANRKSSDFGKDDLRLMKTIATQIADAIERNRLYSTTDADLRARVEELDALTRVSNEFGITTDLDRIVEVVRNEILRSTKAQQISIALLLPPEQWTSPTQPIILKRYGASYEGGGSFFPIEERVIVTDAPSLIPDYARSTQIDLSPGTRRSGLAVPVNYGGGVRGVIHLISDIPDAFQERSISFIQSMANGLSIGIGNSERLREQLERSELLRQRADQLTQIFELGRLVRTESTVESILDAVANGIVESIGFNVVLISLADHDAGVMRRIAQAGIPLPDFERVKQNTPGIKVIQDLFIPKYRVSSSYFLPDEEEPKWRNSAIHTLGNKPVVEPLGTQDWHEGDALLCPLYDSAGKLIGLISVDVPRSGKRPTRPVVEALEIFANQAAFSIENFRLLEAFRHETEATRRERDRLAQLHQVAGAIQRAPDVPTRLKVIADGIQSTGWKRVAITLRDNNLETTELITAGYTPAELEKLRANTLPGIVWRQRLSDPEFRKYRIGQAYYLRNADPWVTENKLMAGAAGHVSIIETTVDLGNWHPLDTIYLPIYGVDQSRVVGIISMDTPETGQPPSETELRPIELFAVQAASTIENTRLYQERTRAAEQESRVNAVMESVSGTLEINEIMLSFARGVEQLLPLTKVSIALIDWTSFRFDIHQATPVNNEVILKQIEPISMDNTALGRAYQEQAGHIYRGNDGMQFEDIAAWRKAGENISLIVPMVAGGRGVGALHIGSDNPDGVGFDDQFQLISRLGNLVAVSIENARLFQQAIDRERFSASLGRVGQSINTLTNLTDVLSYICNEVRNVKEAAGAYLFLREEDRLMGVASSGLDAANFKTLMFGVNDETQLPSAAIRERGATFVNDFRDQTAYKHFLSTPISSMLVIPLLREETLPLGVLTLVHTELDRMFSPTDLEVVSNFAVQAAIAVQRFTLQTTLQERATELTTLTDISGQLTGTLDTDAVANLVIEQLGKLTRYDNVTLWLRRGEKLVIRAAAGYPNSKDLIGIEADIADSQLFQQIASTGRVLNIADVARDPRFPPNTDRPTRSWMGIPLSLKNQLSGLLIVEKREANFYGATQEQLSLAFANQAAVALENARLFQLRDQAAQENTRLYQETRQRAAELNQQAQRLTLLNRVSNALARTIDLENVLEVTLKELVTALGQDRGSALNVESGAKQARLVIEYPRAETPPWNTYLSLVNNPLYDDLKKNQRPVAIFDVSNDPLLRGQNEFFTQRDVLSTMVIPMILGGQVIGIVTVDTTNEYHIFALDELEIAQTIAAQAAVAVQNATLFEQSSVRTRELETLFEATQATSSSLNLEEVVNNASNQLIPALLVEAVTIALYDEMNGRLTVKADIQSIPDPVGVQRPGSVLYLNEYPARAQVLRERQVLTLYADDPNLDPAEKRLFAMRRMSGRVLLPMVARDQAVGLITVEIVSPAQRFEPSSIRLARSLTNQTAIAVDNARLQTETAFKLQELLVINELATSLSSTIDSEQIYNVLRTQLPTLSPAEMLILAVFDPDTGLVSYPVAYRQGKPFAIPPHPLEGDEISYVIKRRVPLLLAGDDIAEVLRVFNIQMSVTQARSFLGVPLLTGDTVVGALAVGDSESKRAFGLDDQRVLTTVAAQVAASIQNSRLFERNRRFTAELETRVQQRTDELRLERDRLNFLFRITGTLTASLDIDQVLSRVLDIMASAVEADMGAILGIDTMSGTLLYRATYGMDMQAPDDLISYSQSEGLVGWVIEMQQSLIVADVQQDVRWLRRSAADDIPRSALVALLSTGDDILGVVTLYSQRAGVFRDANLQLIEAAAGQVARAMNNADLYGLIREQAERLGALLRQQQVESTRNLAIVESIADGVMVTGPNGDITQFNTAAERILGIVKKSIISRGINQLAGLYTSTIGKRWFTTLQTWMDDPTSYRPGDAIEEQLNLPDGKVVQVVLSPVTMPDQFLGTVSVFRDITREIEVDRMKSEFVATVSHELRTPMTSIKGYADLLLMGAAGQPNEAQQRFLSTIKTNADRLSVLVNELLDISRIDRGTVKLNLQLVDIREIAEESFQYLQKRISDEKKEINVENRIQSGLPLVNGDFEKLVQILNNLMDNAFSYTYAGGRVTLDAKIDGKYVVMSVSDTGIGISKENQKRVFERFFRGEENQLVMETSGTGLGLSIVKEYVVMHNGDIWLESELGKGTTFFVRLPTVSS
jgi:PAS domain S-box-containing protein